MIYEILVWKELANTIESEVHQQSRLFVTDPQIEKLARHYTKVIIRDKLNKAHASGIDRPAF